MKEFLPIVIGILVGAGVMHLVPTGRTRPLIFGAGCLGGGALASWMNGELAGSLWALFVSIDALQTWLGSALYIAALHFGRRTIHHKRP